MALTKVTRGVLSTGIDDQSDATAITINSSENVSIGTTDVGASGLSIANDLNYSIAESSGSHVNLFRQGSSAACVLAQGYQRSANANAFASSIGSNWKKSAISQNYGSIIFYTDGLVTTAVGTDVTPTERMRITDVGAFLFNTTDTDPTNDTTGNGTVISNGGWFATTAQAQTVAYFNRTGSSDGTILDFRTNGLVRGSISISGSTTAYNTSSDYRLKENVVTDWDATTRLKQLKPSRFNFIADADTTVDGFLAHEVSDIVPEAITGEKDATETLSNVVLNSDNRVIAKDISEDDWTAGKTGTDAIYPSDSTWEASHTKAVYQSIDQSKLVPLLVKTIQELEARITTLENA